MSADIIYAQLAKRVCREDGKCNRCGGKVVRGWVMTELGRELVVRCWICGHSAFDLEPVEAQRPAARREAPVPSVMQERARVSLSGAVLKPNQVFCCCGEAKTVTAQVCAACKAAQEKLAADERLAKKQAERAARSCKVSGCCSPRATNHALFCPAHLKAFNAWLAAGAMTQAPLVQLPGGTWQEVAA